MISLCDVLLCFGVSSFDRCRPQRRRPRTAPKRNDVGFLTDATGGAATLLVSALHVGHNFSQTFLNPSHPRPTKKTNKQTIDYSMSYSLLTGAFLSRAHQRLRCLPTGSPLLPRRRAARRGPGACAADCTRHEDDAAATAAGRRSLAGPCESGCASLSECSASDKEMRIWTRKQSQTAV